MAQSLEGYPFSGKLQDLNDNAYEHLEKRFVTVIPLGPSRGALDVVASGYYRVVENDVVEASSDDKSINATAHSAKKGDIIRLKTTANAIDELEIAVRSVTANNIQLEGVLSASLTSGDTFDILRPVAQRFDSSGASLSTVIAPPIQFVLDGVNTTVTEDTGTPANNAPLPVKITGATGDINITAGDLSVQLDHTGVNYDSIRIGDGTDLLAISSSGEALVQPNGHVADNAADSGNPIKVGGRYNSTPPTYANGDRADLQVDVNGNLKVAEIALSSSSSSVHAEDDAHVSGDNGSLSLVVRQDTLSSSTSTNGDYAAMKSNANGELYVKDTDLATNTSAISGKLPATLGQKTSANSMAVVLPSDQTVATSVASLPLPTGAATETTLSSVLTSVQLLDNAIAGNEMQVDIVGISTISTEATLSAMSAKLPATLGQKASAASLAVVLPSDQELPKEVGYAYVDSARYDYTSGTVGLVTWVEVKASVAGVWRELEIFDSSGQTMELGFGAAASEARRMLIFPGGNGRVKLAGSAATRITVRAVSAAASAGEICINFYN